MDGGDGGIRTLDTPLQAYNGLANRRLQPLGHVSGRHRYAAEPDATQAIRLEHDAEKCEAAFGRQCS